MAIKMKRGETKLVLDDGSTKTRAALVYKGLAVFKVSEYYYNVTHIASGLNVCSLFSMRDARDVIEKLTDGDLGVDWTGDVRELRQYQDVLKKVLETVRPYRTGAGR